MQTYIYSTGDYPEISSLTAEEKHLTFFPNSITGHSAYIVARIQAHIKAWN